uniref:Uncharacterized protein n=1 Tax=Ralstonia solanacearum TaxID=305 RepID=A0A0S4XD47_RALSL|nr:protein of unknown function [Ralstonia solanacearum]
MTDSTSNSPRILVGSVTGLTLFDHRELICVKRSPLPGIVIFVHGVNSCLLYTSPSPRDRG